MQKVTAPTRKFVAPLFMGFAVFLMQRSTAEVSINMALMIALAGVIQMTAMALRDAEFRTLTTAYGLNSKDIIAYGSWVIIDALLLFGILTGAGLLLPWDQFMLIAGLIVVIMPVVVFAITRKHYAPDRANPASGARHWLPPVVLLAVLGALWVFEGFQMPSGSQPFVSLVMLSVICTPTDTATRFAGHALFARYAIFAAALILLIWHYQSLT